MRGVYKIWQVFLGSALQFPKLFFRPRTTLCLRSTRNSQQKIYILVIPWTYPHHECMRWMHKVCYVSLGSALEAQLAVSGHWIVHENDVIGQFAIVQNFTMILTQLATFCFKPELILKKRKKKVIRNIKYIPIGYFKK